MDILKKSRSILKKLLYLSVILLISLLVFVYFFLKSPSFLKRVEQIINSHIERPIEIGSISLANGHGIIIRDVIIRKADKAEPFIILPHLEIGFSLSALLNRSIDKIDIRKPKLFLTLEKGRKPEAKESTTPIPFSFKKISIEDGEVILRVEEGKSFHMSSINLSLEGAYNVNGHELKIENASLSSSLLGSLDIEGSLKNFPSKNPDIDLAIEGEAIPLHKIKKVLTGSVAELMDAIDAEGYAKVDLFITGNLKTPLITMEAEVMYQSIDLNKVATVFPDFSQKNGFTIKGTGALHSTFTITMPERADPQVIGKANLSITRGGFSSPDATMAGEGIDMNVLSSFEFSLPLSMAEFTISAQATDFELLIGRFYGNFKNRNVNLSLEGEYSRANDSIKVSRSELSLTDVGTILISGEIVNLTESPHFTADVHLRELSNKSAYDFFIRETFQDRFAFLSQLETGGITSMILSVKGAADRLNTHGEIKVVDMDILDKSSDLYIQGVNISMPVDISYPVIPPSPPLIKGGRGDFQRKEIGRFGSLRVQNISWGDLHFKDLDAFPAIWQNAIIFKEDIFMPIFGGSFRLKDINYNDIFSPKRNLLLSIQIDNIDLDKISSALNIPRFSGSLSGFIPKVSFIGNSLLTEGEIILELFGGEMRVSDLSMNNVFSPIASLKSSIGLKEIDLGKLTNTFEFGHISGIMQGYLKNLVITNGQAESFESSIETVKRKDVGQWISVDALKKISILGSGSSSSILNRGIYQFLKKYRYKKIGFKGSLRNDNFLLLGIEAEGNKQYLVKGGALPPKVDVINYTQNISFQEMLKRLKRIKQMER